MSQQDKIDERTERRKRIKSAIDWLEKADNSIAEEQDIKGDLNLLLARAELQHETENKKSSAVVTFVKEFFTKTGTMLVAGVIAAIIFYYPKSNSTVADKIESDVENTVAIESAENITTQIQPIEPIIVEPIQVQNTSDELAEKIHVEKIEFERIDEDIPKPIEYVEQKIEQNIYPPDTNYNTESTAKIQDLVTSAGIVLRSK